MSSAQRDYYATLECTRDADGNTLKSAYRKLAMKFHPDKNPGCKDSEARFKAISEAYDCLRDPQKRAAYDRFGKDGLRGGGGSGAGADFGDIGDIGFHPSLFFAGICGPGFQAALQLFGIDACQSGVEAQICPKAFGPAVLELGLCATNHQSCRADGGAVYR